VRDLVGLDFVEGDLEWVRLAWSDLDSVQRT